MNVRNVKEVDLKFYSISGVLGSVRGISNGLVSWE